jgi:hypothetical protein
MPTLEQLKSKRYTLTKATVEPLNTTTVFRAAGIVAANGQEITPATVAAVLRGASEDAIAEALAALATQGTLTEREQGA